MTTELIKHLSDAKELIDDWNSKKIPNEEEFLSGLKKVSLELYRELRKPQIALPDTEE